MPEVFSMRRTSSCLRQLCSLLLVGCLAGCTPTSGPQALVDAYHFIRENGSSHVNSRLDPRFSYLRVELNRQEIYMVLGYVDNSPDGPVEVWYSSSGEVVRLLDGRLVGITMDNGTDWLSVSFSKLPRWEQIGAQASFERRRDSRPGYRYGISEKMLIRRVSQPNDTRLQVIPASSLTWFEERAEDTGGLPTARYGVSMSGETPKVVYAEQCLSNDLCFSWQKWTPRKESKP